jgi:DNA-binding XRE family transcriptional regulator
MKLEDMIWERTRVSGYPRPCQLYPRKTLKKTSALQASAPSVRRSPLFSPDGGGKNGTIGDRILSVREHLEHTQRSLGEALGMTGQAITAWESGHNYPSVDNLIGLHRETGCNLHWLLTGKGARGALHSKRIHP